MIGPPIAFPCLQFEYPFVVSSQDVISTTILPELKNVTTENTFFTTITTVLSTLSVSVTTGGTTISDNMTTVQPLLSFVGNTTTIQN